MIHVKAIFGAILAIGAGFAITRAWARPAPAPAAGASIQSASIPPVASSEPGQPIEIWPAFTVSSPAASEAYIVNWKTPAAGLKYQAAFDVATLAYDLPAGLLARVAYQESRYRDDIVTGKTKSTAGALGLMQFMPATAAQYGFDPLDPYASIDGAGRYLRDLYKKFGNWKEAVASYNWGQGNVAKKGLAKAPKETRNYFTEILADLGIAV